MVFSGQAQAMVFCSEPSKPYLPSGYSASYEEMGRAQDEVNEYFEDVNEYVECLQSEITDSINEAQRVQSDWESAVSSFKMAQ